MAHKANHYAISNASANNSQGSKAINEIGNLLGSMALGPDPSDQALFQNRLLQGKGYQLSNRGAERRQASVQGLAGNTDLSTQLLRSLNLDPTKISPESAAQFSAFLANAKNPNLPAMAFSNTGRGVASTSKEKEALAQSKLMNPVLLEHANTLVQNLGLTGDKTIAETFAVDDAATNASVLNDANVRNVDQGTAKLLASMELAKTGTDATASLTGAKQKRVEILAPAEVDKIKAETTQTQVETSDASKKSLAQTDAIRSATENNRLQSEKLAYLTTLKTLHERAKKAATQSKNTKEMEVADQEILKIQAQINEINATAEAVKDESEVRVEKEQAKVEMVETQTENLNLDQINRNLESAETQDLIKGKTDLTSAMTTGQQVKTYDDSTLTKAKTNLVGAKEQGELTDIAATITGTGTGTGKNQRDFRKTEAFQRVGRKVADEGVAYTGTKQADEWGWQDDLEEFTTHVWPDDDKKLRGLMLPFPTDKAEQAKRMEAGKLFLRKAGDYDKDSQRIILKSILQVK
jgi:hypothetical protein